MKSCAPRSGRRSGTLWSNLSEQTQSQEPADALQTSRSRAAKAHPGPAHAAKTVSGNRVHFCDKSRHKSARPPSASLTHCAIDYHNEARRHNTVAATMPSRLVTHGHMPRVDRTNGAGLRRGGASERSAAGDPYGARLGRACGGGSLPPREHDGHAPSGVRSQIQNDQK